MAVVQISKIQVRRGQKNSNSGIPQLSSAELAWAIDSQELYIGNGSVAEGAPYVGNTKILTEHDNILDLASSYQFASTDTSITLSVPRSLQSKLDEYVSIADFGAVGDGSTDCTDIFETAFSQLFRNSNSNYKKVLLIPNGEYLISGNLAVPSNAIIKGETQLGAVINIGANNIRFITEDGTELSGFDSSNRPQNVDISNLSILRSSGSVIISGLADSVFEKVRFVGEYRLGDAVASVASETAAVVWLNTLAGTRVNNVQFKSCQFDSNSLSVKCSQTVAFESIVGFDRCKFLVNHTGIYVDGVAGQDTKWYINDCDFEEMAVQAFRSTAGRRTIIHRTRFKNCGNDISTAADPAHPIVYFGEKVGNLLVDCSSDRQQAAGIVSSTTINAVSEVYNSDKTQFVDRNYSDIFLSDSFRPLSVFSALNRYIVLNYVLTLSSHTRLGQIIMTIDEDLSTVSISDNYQYSSLSSSTSGGALMTNFEFSAELRDNDTDSGIETVVLSYKNPIGTGATGNISFDVAYGV
jgi:hypothetical protein